MRTLVPIPPGATRAVRARRTALVALVTTVGALVLASVLLGTLRLVRSGALPGVAVAGVDVGGFSDAGVAMAVERYGERREDAEVTVALRDAQVTGTAAELGYGLDRDATVEAVLRRGRQTNPVAALWDQVHAFRGTLEVAPVERVDTGRLDAWVDEANAVLTQPPIEGTLEITGATVTPVYPETGAAVRTGELRQQLRASLLGPRLEHFVQAEEEAVSPETTVEAVEAVRAEAERAVSGSVVLSRDGASATFSPDDIGEALVVVRDGAALHLDVDAQRVLAAVEPATAAAWTARPIDATFTVSGGTVHISPSSEGFSFDPDVAAAQLLRLATSEGPREAILEGEALAPALSTAEAEQLRIVERVSSFTTEFPPDQSRVTNIHRIADMVDGVVLRPGETFSVNGHVGRRTADKGFVGGGAIFDGEFVEQVGGGVSQFATTLYNAAYFGGYAIPQHKPHSYYISRYPAGREATLNYPDVDLKIRNSSPHGVLVKTSHTSTSVTVSFYGTSWVQVDAVAGERTDVTPPEVETRTSGDLPPGAERVVQEGREGFTITVTRVLTYPDGRVERQPQRTRYLPEPRIIERGAS
ncbi:MAG TPA: VanW family protein [Egibacteraceae bacterium]|nr:VanW family protein [Egibacteraceae bacterium]